MEQFIGPLPPPVALRLYQALVEPHLTYGCEVALDVQDTALQPLEKVQTAFLRRGLALGSQCQHVPLHTETGIWPLRYRRLYLALRYLEYILRDCPPFPYAALRESFSLANRPPTLGGPVSSWWSDLYLTLAALPSPVPLGLDTFPTVDSVQQCITALQESLLQHLTLTALQSGRLPAVQTWLRGPRAPTTVAGICAQRAYLSLPAARLRSALTRLVASEHPLAVEVLRHLPPAEAVPHKMRACRFCRRRGSVEDEPHVLLYCAAPAVRDLRVRFLAAADLASAPFARFRTTHMGWPVLDFALRCEPVLPSFAEFVSAVFQLCDDTPVLVLRDLDVYCASTIP